MCGSWSCGKGSTGVRGELGPGEEPVPARMGCAEDGRGRGGHWQEGHD
jgi:hypothetical protein